MRYLLAILALLISVSAASAQGSKVNIQCLTGVTGFPWDNCSSANPFPVAVISGGGGSGAVTIANGADVALGSTTDAVGSTPSTGSAATLIALAKAINNNVSSAIPAGTNLIGSVTTAPTAVTTTTVNSTVSVTNTFQAALATSPTRKACLLQNTGTHIQYIYFGTLGSANTLNAFQISPGQTISCATINGLVLTDAVNITGTAADGYVVTSQ